MSQSSGTANESGLRALGAQIDSTEAAKNASTPGAGRTRSGKVRGFRRSGKPKWSVRRKVFTWVGGIVIVALLLAGGLYGYLRYRYSQIPKLQVPALVPAASGPFNMLVIGSDSRVGQGNTSAFGSASQVTGQRSDVVMIWHVVPSTGQITIVSIPRDTMMSMDSNQAQLGQFNRINATFGGGANPLVQTIQDNLGIPISHVVQVGFDGFQGTVNALGGVWMNFPYPAKDAYSGLNITSPGCQLLDGAQALAVARSRHYQYLQNGVWQYDGTSDFGRIQRQDAFLKALLNGAKNMRNPFTANAFLGSINQGIAIDNQLSLGDLMRLAFDFRGASSQVLNAHTLPTVSTGYVAPWGDVLFVDQPAAQQMLTSIFGSELKSPSTPPPDTSLQTPAPPPVSATSPSSNGSSSTSRTSSATPPATPAPPSFNPTPCSPH